MSNSAHKTLAIWQGAMTPPRRHGYTFAAPADPAPLAARLPAWTPFDGDLLRQWLRLNHIAFKPGSASDFPEVFNDACKGNVAALIAATGDIAADHDVWARWFKSIVTFPAMLVPHGRPLMLPDDAAAHDRLIALVAEAKSTGDLRHLSTIIFTLDFLHNERRNAFDAILSGVFHRSRADRNGFFLLHERDLRAADNLFRSWRRGSGRPNWRTDGLEPADAAAKLKKQFERIQKLRGQQNGKPP